MGLINYTNLEDGTKITANIFNERFGQIIALLNGGLDSSNFANGGVGVSSLAVAVFEKIYPVGSLYFNATDDTNPNELLGFGTWVAYAAGRVPVGYDSSDSDFNAAEKTGGSKLLQAHTHGFNNTGVPSSNHAEYGTKGSDSHFMFDSNYNMTTTLSTGGGNSENLQPFITVYCWKRTA